MTTTTREIVERLARDAGFRILQGRIVAADGGCSGEATESVERFWVLAMEHAAGICDGVSSNCESWEDGGQDGMIAADQCAYAIREAAK